MIHTNKKGDIIMSLISKVDAQIEALQPLLQLLHWNIRRIDNTLYFYYEDLEIGRVPGFINRKGPIYHANDKLFNVFMNEDGLSLSLIREIKGEETRLQISPIRTNEEFLLQFYCQYPQGKIDCILRISETKLEMIEANEVGHIKCKATIHENEDNIETSLTMGNDDRRISILSSKIGPFLAPCHVIGGIVEQRYYKKGKKILANVRLREESLTQAAKNIFGLSKVVRLRNELLELFETFLPGISEYLENHYDSFRKLSSKEPSDKAKNFQNKLWELHFDTANVPSIGNQKNLK